MLAAMWGCLWLRDTKTSCSSAETFGFFIQTAVTSEGNPSNSPTCFFLLQQGLCGWVLSTVDSGQKKKEEEKNRSRKVKSHN